nr:3'-5' exonuclease [Psychroserpens sp. SPM9]
MDEIFDYSQQYNASFSGFLEHWERKKDKLTIASPTGKDAIQIMTIHKSKGLEFPVVIFPYANQDIYFDINPKVWFPVDEQLFNGFSHLYLNMNKDLEAFNPIGEQLYNDYRSQLELDSLNLLYVVLTRAVEQLYIISDYDVDRSQNEKVTWYSGLFINYLKSIGVWNNTQLEYSFGRAEKPSEAPKEQLETIEQKEFISTKKETHNLNIVTSSGSLWDTAQERAIERGNLVHEIMSFITTKEDIDFALNHLLDLGLINAEQLEDLKPTIHTIVTHQQLQHLFDGQLTVYNEKDIISKDGQLLRPDRIVINTENQATIIDYKTGLENSKHKEQLYDYQDLLEDMGFTVIKKILIYINDVITIKEF